MQKYTIPAYYTDPTLSDEEKLRLDYEMVARDFPRMTE